MCDVFIFSWISLFFEMNEEQNKVPVRWVCFIKKKLFHDWNFMIFNRWIVGLARMSQFVSPGNRTPQLRSSSCWGVLSPASPMCSACRSPKTGHRCAHMLLVHTQQKFRSQNFSQLVCALLFSSDKLNLQNIKTSVCSISNSSSTDVFIFCIKRQSNDNKREQIRSTIEFYLYRNPTKLYVRTNVKRTDSCLFFDILGDLQAEHLTHRVTFSRSRGTKNSTVIPY